MATTKKKVNDTPPRAGVAGPPFDYGVYKGVDNEMRKKAGYPPITNTKSVKKKSSRTTTKKK